MIKRKTILEALGYTPEKEQEILQNAKKSLETSRQIVEGFRNRVMTLTLEDFVNNPETVQVLRKKIQQAEAKIIKIRREYSNNLDNFEEDSNAGDELDMLLIDIQEASSDLDELNDILEDLLEIGGRLRGDTES